MTLSTSLESAALVAGAATASCTAPAPATVEGLLFSAVPPIPPPRSRVAVGMPMAKSAARLQER